jgi:hypothetical protein
MTPEDGRVTPSDGARWEVPVMRGPADERAAGLGRLRASHADREQAVETLKAAFVEGRLTRDELDARAGQALTARTYAELAAVTADVPAVTAAAPPPENATVKAGARVVVAATAPTAAMWTTAWLTQASSQAVINLAVTVTLIWLGILILTGAVMLESCLARRRYPLG